MQKASNQSTDIYCHALQFSGKENYENTSYVTAYNEVNKIGTFALEYE